MEENLEPISEVKLAEPKKMEQCEWCFQFDDDEPKVFAWTNEDMEDEEPMNPMAESIRRHIRRR